jgi:GldM C-terminal domain
MKPLLSAALLFFSSFASAGNKFPAEADTTKPSFSIQPGKGTPIDSNILIVVNDVPAGTIRELKKDINTLFAPENIQSINVLKEKHALDKYAEKGKYGVIEFVLKDVIIKDSSNNEIRYAENKIFEKVEVEASFPGGNRTWRDFLVKNLNASVPNDNGAPTGLYTTIIQFIVDKEGNISEIKPLTNNGYGMENEVIRVISKGPKWNPAYQSGRSVKAFRKQPVSFMVSSEDGFDISIYSVKKGIDNPIEIKVAKVKDEDLEVSVSDGSIKRVSEGNYIIKTEKTGRIILSVYNKKKNIIEGKASLEVK